MDITLHKKNETEAVLKMAVVADMYQADFKKRVKEEAQKLQIRGFRDNSPGKIAMVKQRFGKDLLKETVLTSANEQAQQYVTKHGLNVLGEIEPDQAVLDKIDWQEGATFNLPFQIDMAGPFELTLDKEITVEALKISAVPKKEVETHVKTLRQIFGQKEAKKKIEAEDFISGMVTYKKTYKMPLSFRVTEEVLAAATDLTGKEVGTTLPLTTKVLKIASSGTLALLKKMTKVPAKNFPFTIQSITSTTPAPLDQKFFDLILGHGKAKNVKEFQEKMQDHLLMRYQNQAEQLFETNLAKALIEKTKIALPKKYKAAEAKQIAWDVIANRICKENKIEATPEEIMEALSKRYHRVLANIPEKEREVMIQQRIQQDITDPEKRNLTRVGSDVVLTKMYDLIKEKITVKPKKVTVTALKKELQDTA